MVSLGPPQRGYQPDASGSFYQELALTLISEHIVLFADRRAAAIKPGVLTEPHVRHPALYEKFYSSLQGGAFLLNPLIDEQVARAFSRSLLEFIDALVSTIVDALGRVALKGHESDSHEAQLLLLKQHEGRIESFYLDAYGRHLEQLLTLYLRLRTPTQKSFFIHLVAFGGEDLPVLLSLVEAHEFTVETRQKVSANSFDIIVRDMDQTGGVLINIGGALNDKACLQSACFAEQGWEVLRFTDEQVVEDSTGCVTSAVRAWLSHLDKRGD